MVGLTHFYPKELMVLITSKTNGPNIIKTRVKFHMYISGFNYMAVSFVTEYKLPKVTEISAFAEDTLPLNVRAYDQPYITIYTKKYSY